PNLLMPTSLNQPKYSSKIMGDTYHRRYLSLLAKYKDHNQVS
ncbi:hypothetical protein D043_2427B, partial [Vibrio parahaemolyticus EKP-021]